MAWENDRANILRDHGYSFDGMYPLFSYVEYLSWYEFGASMYILYKDDTESEINGMLGYNEYNKIVNDGCLVAVQVGGLK